MFKKIIKYCYSKLCCNKHISNTAQLNVTESTVIISKIFKSKPHHMGEHPILKNDYLILKFTMKVW